MDHKFDILSDAILQAAVKENFKREVSLLDEAGLASQYEFSSRHNRNMRRLFTRFARSRWQNQALLWAKRVAIFFLILTSLLFGMIMLHPQARAEIRRVIIEYFEEFFVVRFTGGQIDQDTLWEMTYLPQGYQLNQTIDLGPSKIRHYLNDEGALISFDASYMDESLTIAVDNENHDKSLITLHGVEASLMTARESGQENGIMWQKGGFNFIIFTTEPVETLIRMAESVRPMEQ